MEKLQNGNDVAVYIRNALLAVLKISREFGIDISFGCFENGTYGCAEFGNFRVTEFSGHGAVGTLEYYEYAPLEIRRTFKIEPSDIVLENALSRSKQTGHKLNISRLL